VDFNEIKHYFNTGEHLAKPSVVDRVQAVRNHLVGDGMERRTLGIVETRPHYTIILKGFILLSHTVKTSNLDHPQELFAVLNEIEDAYAGYEFA
jgi:hypothetical protein